MATFIQIPEWARYMAINYRGNVVLSDSTGDTMQEVYADSEGNINMQ